MRKHCICRNCKKILILPEVEAGKYIRNMSLNSPSGDVRSLVLTVDNTYDNTMYFNYLDTIRELISEYGKHGAQHMLELGYLPILMAPSFCEDKYLNLVTSILNKYNIPYLERPAESLISNFRSTEFHDIWVSKMDLRDIVPNKQVPYITVKDVYEALNIELR